MKLLSRGWLHQLVEASPLAKTATTLALAAQGRLEVARDLLQRDGVIVRRVTGHLGGKPGDAPLVSVGYVGREPWHHDFLFPYGDKTRRHVVEQETFYEGNVLGLLRKQDALTSALAGCDVQVRELFGVEPRVENQAVFYPYLRARLAVQPTIDEQLAHVRSKSHAQKLRKIQRGALTARTSAGLEDFERFYDVMYAPHARARFGGMSFIEPKDSMRDTLAARGTLLLVEEDGTPIAGAMLLRNPREPGTLLYFRNGIVGSADLTPNAMGERNAALDLFVMEHAIQIGARVLDYDLTTSVITDGVFTHKRRIGCDFQPAPYSPRFALTMRQAVRPRILGRYPVVVERRGQLEAWLGAAPGEAPAKLGDWNALVRGHLFPSCKRVVVAMTVPPPEGRKALEDVLRETLKDTGVLFTVEHAAPKAQPTAASETKTAPSPAPSSPASSSSPADEPTGAPLRA